MGAPVACTLSVWLALSAAPARASGVGEQLFVAAAHTPAAPGSVEARRWLAPDTSRTAVVADTARRPAPPVSDASAAPDADRPTRKTVLLTALAIAALTVTTLLLYNVRSR